MTKIFSSDSVSRFGIIFKNFITFYTTLLLFSVPILFLILWRNLLSLVFLLFYNGRYFLVPAEDAFLSCNKVPNTMNLNFVIFVKDICDLQGLQTRIVSNISTTDKDWVIPYKLLFHAVVKKFGFYCYEDKRETFDINHHVRLNPHAEDTHQVYSESELMSIIETTASQAWDDSRPRWEMLLIPKIRKENTGEICSAIQINMSHVYVDGISLANFMRNCVMDQPSPKLSFDPVNPPIPKITLIQKILLYIKVIFIGPHLLLKTYGCSEEQVLHEDQNLMVPCYKFMGRSTLPLSLERMRQIRKTFKCSTQAVFHSALVGALKKLSQKKGNCPIPQEILAGLSLVRFPYPNEYITNRAVPSIDLIPIGIEDPVARLRKINIKLRNMTPPEVLLAGEFNSKLVGILPAGVMSLIFSSIKVAYVISNVPGMMGMASLMGKEIPLIFGFPPLVNGIRVVGGISCYDGNFCIAFVVQESELFKTRTDLDQFIEEFENELKYYVTASSV